MKQFELTKLPQKFGEADTYISRGKEPAANPTFRFMLATLLGPMRWLWQKAAKNRCDDIAWAQGSVWLADIFEQLGGRIVIEGLSHLRQTDGPVVIIANHMSTLETFLLPGIIRPIKPVTFVVKKSLTTMPFFGPIMRSRNPVVVERKNPRVDLAIVLEEGQKRLEDGISVVVFPQHTRSLDFNAAQFNSIGIKLARKAKVKVLPLALKTDAWGQGKRIKELGKIRPDLPVHFRFAPALRPVGTGKSEHTQVCEFIETTVGQWQKDEGVNR